MLVPNVIKWAICSLFQVLYLILKSLDSKNTFYQCTTNLLQEFCSLFSLIKAWLLLLQRCIGGKLFQLNCFFFQQTSITKPIWLFNLFVFSTKATFYYKILNLKSRSTIIYFKPQKIGKKLKSSPCINI